MSNDEFYIGYDARAPASLGRFLRRIVLGLIVAGVGIAALLASMQRPFDPGTFEFGVVREFEGWILTQPVPMLLAERPGGGDLDAILGSRLLLVAPGKFGADALVEGLDGKYASLSGSLIYRGSEAMIELVPGSVEASLRPSPQRPVETVDLGQWRLEGEIVDAKCYLGVMKPGRQKTHRACAARCISGGIPPILRVESEEGEPLHLLLVGAEGSPVNRQILDFVAEPVEITGQVRRLDGQRVLYADPASIRRLGG